MKIQLLAAAALAVFTAGPGAVTASSLRGAVTDSEDLDLALALEGATDYPKVDVYSDYAFDPEEEDADLDLDFDEDGEDMDLVSNWRGRNFNNRRFRNFNNRRFRRFDNRRFRRFDNRRFRRFDNRRFRNFGNRSFRNFDRFGRPRWWNYEME